MTATELGRVSEYILDRWATGTPWRHPEKFFEDFAPLKFSVAMGMVQSMFRGGRVHAPTPSEVLSAVRDVKGFEEPGEQPCIKHVWGIIEESETGFREAMCAVCGLTGSFPPGRLQTPGEMEAST